MTFTRNLHRGWPLIAAALSLAGCGGSSHRHTGQPKTATARPPSTSLTELLSVPAVGRIHGRCRPGDPRWTIESAPSNVATDSVIYRVKIRFAVAAATGDTTACALIATTLTAATYYPGGQPPS
jgi:hypothetical protein